MPSSEFDIAIGRPIRIPEHEWLGDAIGYAVAECLDGYAVYHGPSHAFTDPCPDPDTCGKPHTHADIEPTPPAVRHTTLIDW